jgi:hypothetical protein
VTQACREAADTVRPEAIRSLDLEPERRPARSQSAATTRKGGRVLGPLAAAAAVAVVIAAVVLVPRLASGASGNPGPPKHTSTPKPNPLTALPKFTVLNNTNAIDVVTTATGRIVGRLRAPARQGFSSVVGTTGDRTFFATASLNPQTACRTFFYRFTLSAKGQPSPLTPLPVGRLIGLPTAVAANASRSLMGFSMVQCASSIAGPIGNGRVIGGIGLVDLATDKIIKLWSYTMGDDYATDLTMSADGRLLGYSDYLNNNDTAGQVLQTSSPSGTTERYSRIVVRETNLATALSPNGQLMYAVSGSRDQVLAAYKVADGHLVGVLHRWPTGTTLARPVIDPAGGYLIVPFEKPPAHRKRYPLTSRIGDRCFVIRAHKAHRAPLAECPPLVAPKTQFASVNLTTGAVTTLPFTVSGPPSWGVVAW